MPTISLLKKYKNTKNPVIYKKNIKLNIFVFINNNIKIYNGKELKKIELMQYNNYNDKIGSFVRTRRFKQKKINKSKIKK